jgi:ribonucleoside-triphosphate reductase
MSKCNVEVWSRVCGFFRPIHGWNNGKQEEHKDKKTYDISKAYSVKEVKEK